MNLQSLRLFKSGLRLICLTALTITDKHQEFITVLLQFGVHGTLTLCTLVIFFFCDLLLEIVRFITSTKEEGNVFTFVGFFVCLNKITLKVVD